MFTHVSATKKAKSPKPLSVRRGPVEVLIYSGTNTAKGKTYERFSLVYRETNGARKVRNFSDLNEAKMEAELVATRLANGQTDIFNLKNADVAELISARETLAPFGLTVSRGANDLAAALKRLPADTTLFEAVDWFTKRHHSSGPKRTVKEAVQEFIADRRGAECSDIHLRDLGIRLGRFGRAFEMPMGDVTAPLVQEYLSKLTNEKTKKPAAARSKENALRQIVSLFNFARRMKYVPADLVLEIADIPNPKKQHAEIGIYSPAEIARMFAEADSAITPALAIAAFAGLRLAEVARLDWSEVKLGERVIVVSAANSKTASRRLVPISDNLAAWLANSAKAFGPVNPCSDDPLGNALGNRFERAAVRAKVSWKRNGLRHSYISYRVAITKDVAATALECGNSPAIIFSNYRALATEAEAKSWFGIVPEAVHNVLPMVAVSN